MEVSNQHELLVFFGAVAGGAAIGLLLDLFRLLRRNCTPGPVAVWVQDIVFWLLLTVIVYATVFITNSAVLRWYEFVAMGLGFTLYLLTLSKAVLAVLEFIVMLFRRMVQFLIKAVLLPVCLLMRLFRRPARFLRRKITAAGRGAARVGKRIGRRTRKNFVHLGRVFRKV